jgi:hypothetical protein
MKLIFFDESKNGPEHSHYHIGAICIDEENLQSVEQEISNLAIEVFGSSVLQKSTEFHASEIYGRKNHFRNITDFDYLNGILEKIFIILSRKDVFLIDIQINTQLLYGPQSPEDIAFMFLCERANTFLRAKNSLGMLIGDRENNKVSTRFSTSLSEYKVDGTEFAYGTKITNLVDSVHFTESHLSRFLQLADVYAWILQFQLKNRGSEQKGHKAIISILNKEKIDLGPSKYKEWPKQ